MHVNRRLSALLESFNHPSLPGIDLSLERILQLLAALGHPEQRLPPIIHVAGTNGKGSTIAFMRAMLEAQGKKVHVYTSPHLVRFNERIVVAGKPISDYVLTNILEQLQGVAKDIPVTFFEATTVVAFIAFSRRRADYLLLEVGMGGRLDATNVITPVASVITPIALDHQEFLGNDLATVAREKAGIIKDSVPVITGNQPPAVRKIIEEAALLHGSKLVIVDTPWTTVTGLEGDHQRSNAALAVAALHTLGAVTDKAIAVGLRQAAWPARLQRLKDGPLTDAVGAVWLDGGHNAHAAAAIAAWAKTKRHPIMLLCGLMARKDAAAYFAPLADQFDHVITMPIPGASDSQDPTVLAQVARKAGLSVEVATDLEAAILLLKRYKPATVLVAGSLYLAGEILKTHE